MIVVSAQQLLIETAAHPVDKSPKLLEGAGEIGRHRAGDLPYAGADLRWGKVYFVNDHDFSLLLHGDHADRLHFDLRYDLVIGEDRDIGKTAFDKAFEMGGGGGESQVLPGKVSYV